MSKEARNIKVRCATWQQVEVFYSKKLRSGRTLTVNVPFNPDKGAIVTLALELPNEMVLAIEGEVTSVQPAPDGKKAAIVLALRGVTQDLITRLQALVADAQGGRRIADGQAAAPAAPARGRAVTVPPPPQPTDAPIDELVDVPTVPTLADVTAHERDVFLDLEKEHRRMREAAAHEVLGVAWDAHVPEIRRGYFALTKRFHPDLFARYRSLAVLQLASEVFIQVNKAYDRMRDTAVAAGDAIIAGPALLPHRGWIAGLDDLAAEEPVAPPARQPHILPEPLPPPPIGDDDDDDREPLSIEILREEDRLTADTLFGDMDLAPSTTGVSAQVSELFATGAVSPRDRERAESLAREARRLIEEQAHGDARERLAAALQLDPRNRIYRALYHAASGYALLAKRSSAEAITQFETALVHDPRCEPARIGLDSVRRGTYRRGAKGPADR